MPSPDTATLTETLDKGLVTARDPSMLRPGELQRANDCNYRPNDNAIWKAPGRTAYNAIALAAGAQQVVPTSTITVGGWEDQDGGTVDLHSPIDDTGNVNSETYIEDTVDGAECEVKFAAMTDPATDTGFYFSFWASAPTTGTSAGITVKLYEGAVLKDTESFPSSGDLPTSQTLYRMDLDMSAVSDFTNLRVRFLSTGQSAVTVVRVSNITANGPSSSSAGVIKGLRYLAFDPTEDIPTSNHLIAYVDDDYYSSEFTAETGTFSLADAGVGDGPTLDAVHYNNKHYLLNGNGDGIPNRVFKSSTGIPTTRRHGLDAITSLPLVETEAGAGWPSADELFGDGFYFFFTVEVVDPGGADEVESTWAGVADAFSIGAVINIGVIEISGTTNGVEVWRVKAGETYVENVNPSATHWRVYFSGPYDTPEFNTSYLANSWLGGEAPITATNDSIILGTQETIDGPLLPGTATNVGGWDNIDNIKTIGGGGATADGEWETALLSNFGITDLTGETILGVQLEFSMQTDNFHTLNRLEVSISEDGGTTYGDLRYAQNTQSGVFQTRFVGGKSDHWGHTLTPSSLTTGNFFVKLIYRGTATLTNRDIDVDFVRVRVFYGTGNRISRTVQFPSISIQVSEVTTVIGANGPPKTASTGDIFEGQLVTNDVNDVSLIWYSLPDQPDYFPALYFTNFETKKPDVVKHIRRLGNKLIVGLDRQIYRINYLPRATDAEFDRGRSWEVISEDHGIIATHGAAVFNPPSKPQLLAYVAHNGLHATDGYQTTTITEDLDWINMVNVSKLDKCVLLNYQKYSALYFYFIPAGDDVSTYPTHYMQLSYHPSHVKEGGKSVVCGPVANICAAGDVARLAKQDVMLTGHLDGKVYVEDRLWADASASGGITPEILTRDIYPAGIGWEFTLERLWVRHYLHDTTGTTVTVTPYWRNTEADYIQPAVAGGGTGDEWTAKTFNTLEGDIFDTPFGTLFRGGVLSRLDIHLIGESIVFHLQETDGSPTTTGSDGLGISYINMHVAGHGLEEKR